MPTLDVRPPVGPSVEEAAGRLLVGGVNSPVRAFRQVHEAPVMLVRGDGAEVVDRDGRAYLDFIMGWGALILGHRHPAVVAALREALSQEVMTGLTHPLEIELARRLVQTVPSVEQVRFTTSGTEACLLAVRLARGVTRRSKLLTFEGCYHGHGDSVLAGRSAGIPAGSLQDTVTVPYNDPQAFDAAMDRHGRALAAVIVEAVPANMGVVLPQPGWLERIRARAREVGALLILDEVVTGFRLGPGGAQTAVGLPADLTAFGKIVGGGLPIGAVGGPRRVMQALAPEGEVYHGGTFAGHPLSMTAGVATLAELEAQPPYERLERLARRLAEGVRSLAARAGVPVQVNRMGSMLTVFFSEQPVTQAAAASASSRPRFGCWARSLRAAGILVPPSPLEALFISAAHTEAHVERFLAAAAEALAQAGAAVA